MYFFHVPCWVFNSSAQSIFILHCLFLLQSVYSKHLVKHTQKYIRKDMSHYHVEESSCGREEWVLHSVRPASRWLKIGWVQSANMTCAFLMALFFIYLLLFAKHATNMQSWRKAVKETVKMCRKDHKAWRAYTQPPTPFWTYK